MIDRATGLRLLGLEVQGQILHVDRTQLAILPRILTALQPLDGRWWFHAWKGSVIRYRNKVGRCLMVRGGVMVNREGLLDRRGSSESAGREGGGRSMVVESGGVGLFGHRPLGATTGFIIGHPDDRVVHDTWRDHPTGFGIDLVPSPQFFLRRHETPAPRHHSPPPPPLLLPVTRSQRARRNKTLARFYFPHFSTTFFFFLSFAPPPSLRPRAFFFYRWWCKVVERLDVFLSFRFFLFLCRERSASNAPLFFFFFFPRVFLLRFISLLKPISVSYRARGLDREKAETRLRYATNRIEEGRRPPGIASRRHSAYPQLGNRRDRIFAGSTVHAILEPRTQNLVVLERWLSSGDNDTTYRDTR